MTQLYHTPLLTDPKQPVNAAIVNAPLAQLDTAIGDLAADVANIAFDDATFSGIVTAAHFVGDGSGLTGIGSGTGGVINTGSTTIGADSDSNGVGALALQTGGVTRVQITAAGEIQLGEVVPTRTHVVYGLGDSLTFAGTYLSELGTLLGAHWTTRNRGIGGNRTDNLSDRLQTEVLDAADGEYLIVLGGINDVIQDVSAATIESNLQAIYDAANAAGLTVIACTITPFKTNTAWSSGRQTVLDTVNTWILNTAANVDYRVDAYDALEEGSTDTLAAAYDSGDHLHLSTAGYELLGTTIHNGATWTPSASNATVALYGGTVGLNQSLLNTDDVTFGALTATTRLEADVWRAHTDGVTLEIQNLAGDELLQVDTGSDAVRLVGDVTFRNATTPGSIAGYYNGATAYLYPQFVFQRSRGAYSAPTVVSENDALGGIVFGGCVGAGFNYQAAATLKVLAGPVAANTSVDGNVYLDVMRSNAEVSVLDVVGAGVVFNQDGDASMDFRVESDGDQFAIYVDASENAISLGGAGTSKVGLYGHTPTAQQVLATGAGHTVDDVITVLQALGAVKQS